MVTFIISMFILIMQFFWKYVDDLMGKGIEAWIIIELMFYVSASLIPLALPLAMLLSSIMTMGNLAENNELTALKSSGLSLYRILRPLTGVVLIIAASTFYFANYVIPVANLKWHSLIFDIQNTKIAAIITPGVYTKDLEGYAIKVDRETSEGVFEEIIIHDKTVPNELKIIRAKKGTLYKAQNGKYLFFELKDGFVTEELQTQPPTFSPDGKIHKKEGDFRPSRRSNFKQATYKLDISGFNLEKTDESLFKNEYEMLNVFQIQHALDSVIAGSRKVQDNFLLSLENSHEYLQAYNYRKASDSLEAEEIENRPKDVLNFKALSKNDKLLAINGAISKAQSKIKNLDSQKSYIETTNFNISHYWIEFHRKFALTYAIIVLFFVGAPLGAIVRKGGFGAPVVIAMLLFMVYFILNTVGENLVASEVMSPFWGMWLASILLTPIALILLYAAANDSPIFDKDTYLSLFKKKK